MIEHLQAISARLASLGYATYLVYAPEVQPQYLVLSGPSWATPDELPLSTTSDDLTTDIRVKAVTGTPEGVGVMLTRIRELLSPRLAETSVPMAGRDFRLRFERSEFLEVDTDLTITGTNRHPAVGVDTYRLVSQPA